MGRTRRWALTEPACYHITHRCQERRFLLKFALDRRNYLRRLRQMAETYPVSVLDSELLTWSSEAQTSPARLDC